MKKTLQEEKERILEISRRINEQTDVPSNSSKYSDTLKDIANSGYNETGAYNNDFIKEGEPVHMAILTFMEALQTKGVPNNIIFQKLRDIVEGQIEAEIQTQNEENDDEE